jgi:hypothetical protein
MPGHPGRTPTGSSVQHSESITVKLGVPLYPNSVNSPPPNQFVYHVYLVQYMPLITCTYFLSGNYIIVVLYCMH